MYWRYEWHQLNFKSKIPMLMIEEAFNEQNERKLYCVRSMILDQMYEAVQNKQWHYVAFYKEIFKFINWEFKSVWKRHNFLKGI